MVVEWLVWLADKKTPVSSPCIVFMMLSYTKRRSCITKTDPSCGTTHSGAPASSLRVYWLAFRMGCRMSCALIVAKILEAGPSADQPPPSNEQQQIIATPRQIDILVFDEGLDFLYLYPYRNGVAVASPLSIARFSRTSILSLSLPRSCKRSSPERKRGNHG